MKEEEFEALPPEKRDQLRQPVVRTTVAIDLARLLGANDKTVWLDTELFVFVWDRPVDQTPYIGVRTCCGTDGKTITYDWRFVRMTPAQLRQLADEIERRQG